MILPLLAAAAAALWAQAPSEDLTRAIPADAPNERRLMDYVRLHHACLALASKDPKICGRLARFPARIDYQGADKSALARPPGYDFLCLSDLHDLELARGRITGDAAAAQRACMAHEEIGHRDFRPQERSRACRILAAANDDPPQETCRRLQPLFSSPAPAPYCEREVRSFSGDPGACSSMGGEPVAHEACSANAAFRRAWSGSDPSLCADSPLCRALWGEGPEACRPYAEKAEFALCRIRGRGDCAGPPALNGARIERAARLLAEAESAVSQLEKAGRCDESFEALTLDLKARKLPAEAAETLYRPLRPELERYYLCLANTRDDPSVCDELQALPRLINREAEAHPISFQLLCRTLFYEAKIAKEMINGGPGAPELCVTRNVIGDRDFRLDALKPACRILASFAGDTESTCGALTPYFDGPTIAKTCPRMMRFVTGDETVCPQFVDEMVHERCLGYASYKKSRGGRDPGLCGDSRYCATLLAANPHACAPYKKELVDKSCGLFKAALLRGPIERHIQEVEIALSDAADQELEMDPPPRVKQLRARAAALAKRLQELARDAPAR